MSLIEITKPAITCGFYFLNDEPFRDSNAGRPPIQTLFLCNLFE